MRAAKSALGVALLLAIGAGGCLSEPVRPFYDDLDGSADTAGFDRSVGSGSMDASVSVDGSVVDSSDVSSDGSLDAATNDARDASLNDTGVDAANEGGSEAGDAGVDGAGNSGLDAASEAEAGCGRTNTIANCGACGVACDIAQSVGASCNGVSCAYTGCAPGFGDCIKTGPPNVDGCETRLNTTSNCTGCMLACDSTHSLGASCNGATCLYSGCAPGYADCFPGAPNIDGCDTPINTISHCTGCNIRCDVTHSLGASCTLGGCAYTGCAPGWTSCSSNPPNAQGCGCPTPGCCGSSCQTTHDNGLGNSFYDCQPVGTFTQVQATAACAAFTGNAAECNVVFCLDPAMEPLICSDLSSTTCACWSYGGGNVGHVFNAGLPGAGNCTCPLTSDPPWN